MSAVYYKALLYFDLYYKAVRQRNVVIQAVFFYSTVCMLEN